MRRLSKKTWLFPLLIPAVLCSCGGPGVEEEMDEWCECMSNALENPAEEGECFAIMDRITKKYEYDADAAAVIRKKVDECQHGRNPAAE